MEHIIRVFEDWALAHPQLPRMLGYAIGLLSVALLAELVWVLELHKKNGRKER